MFGTSQNVMKIEITPVQSEVNVEISNEVSEPKLKRSRISEYARVSDIKNDMSENNPDLGESKNQIIPTKNLEWELMTK